MQEREEKFKVGDMVKIITDVKATYGIIIEHRVDMSMSCFEWLVRLQSGWEVWFSDEELEHVGL